MIFTWNDPSELGIHPEKLFDYLDARRPVLAVVQHRDVVFDVLEETKAGVHCSDVTELKQYLLLAYRDFERLGRVQYNGNVSAGSRYSYSVIARKFADVMD